MGAAGFEPAKAIANGFTVRPLWPLGYTPYFLQSKNLRKWLTSQSWDATTITTTSETQCPSARPPAFVTGKPEHLMAKVTRKRKSRFPLTLHPTGQWCKKIHGKLHYFGKNKREALEEYLQQAADLHAGRPLSNRVISGGLTVKELANHYLAYQAQRAENGEISLPHFQDSRRVLKAFAAKMGPRLPVEALNANHLASYRSAVVKKHAPNSANRFLAIVKAMFNYGMEAELIERTPPLRKTLTKVSVKHLRKHKEAKRRENGDPVFSPEEVQELRSHASDQLRAMILLGINGGFGNTDCADLRRSDIDFKRCVIDYHRVKTAIRRTVPLWPETIEAIKAALLARPTPVLPESHDLVFLTPRGHKWVRNQVRPKKGDPLHVTKHDELTKQFDNLLRELGMKRPGLSFYSLRHTHATLADRARDVHAQRRIMGHAIPGMLGEYIEDIDLDRLQTVVDVVRTAIFGEEVKSEPQQANSESQKA